MSKAITVLDDNDMPCEDWIGTGAEVDECPMKEKWNEGEVRMCDKCGWKIAYNCEERE